MARFTSGGKTYESSGGGPYRVVGRDLGGGRTQELYPIKDIAGRPLKAPIGSPEEKAQSKEAEQIVAKQKAQQELSKNKETSKVTVAPAKVSDIRKKSLEPSVSTYKKMSREEKEKLSKEDFAKRGLQRATTKDLNRFGVTPGLTQVGDDYFLYGGRGTKLDEGFVPKITKFEAAEFGTFVASIPASNIAANTFKETQSEIKKSYQLRIQENPEKYTSQEEIDKLNKEFQSEVTDVYQGRLSESPEYKKAVQSYSGKVSGFGIKELELKNKEPFNIEKAGQTSLLLTPLAAPVLFSKALKEIQEDPNYYSSSGLATTKGDPFAFNEGQVRLSKQAQINLGLGVGVVGITTVASLSNIAKSSDALRIEEGLKLPSKTVGREVYKVGDETFIKTVTSRKTYGFEQSSKIEFPVFAKGSNEFAIGVGKGTSKVRTLDFWKQIQNVKDPYTITTQEFSSAGFGRVSGGVVNGFKLPASFSVTEGSGYVATDKGLTNFLFAGSSKDYGNFVKSYGGKVTKVRAYTNPIIEVGSKGEAIGFGSQVNRVVISAPLKDKSIIFKLPKDTGIDKGYSVFTGGGKKSSQAYLKSLYQADVLSFSSAASDISVKSLLQSQKTIGFIPGVSATKGKQQELIKVTQEEQELYSFPEQYPMLRETQSTNLFGGLSSGLINVNDNRIFNRFTPAFTQLQGQNLKLKQQQKIVSPNLFSPTPVAPFTNPFKGEGFGFKVPPIPLPKFSLFDYGRKRSKKGKYFKGRYAPSVAAIGLNIKAPKIPKLYSKGFGSLILRPVIGKPKKRTKSKTKSKGGKKNGRKRKRSIFEDWGY